MRCVCPPQSTFERPVKVKFSTLTLALASALVFFHPSSTFALSYVQEINSNNVNSLSGYVSANDHANGQGASNATLSINGSGLRTPSSVNGIYAGYAPSTLGGDATGNVLQLNGVVENEALVAGFSRDGLAVDNVVNITVDDQSSEFGSSITSGISYTTVKNNKIYVKSGANFILDGRQLNAGETKATDGSLIGNQVIFESGSVSNLNNGKVQAALGTGTSNFENNEVNIEENAIVYGNIWAAADSQGSLNNGSTFDNNKVTVCGEVYGNIVGVYPNSTSKGKISNTVVTLTGAYVDGDIKVIGKGSVKVLGEGNKLVLTNSKVTGEIRTDAGELGLIELSGVNSVGSIYRKESNLNFVVGKANADEAVLTLTDGATSLSDVTLTVNKDSTAEDLHVYKLIATDNASLTLNNVTVSSEATFVSSSWNLDEFSLADGQSLDLRWGEEIVEPEDPDPKPDPDPEEPIEPEIKPTDNSKTLSESLLGTIAFLNQGAEFIADEGLAAMVSAAKVGELATFGAVHGGTSNYKTGSRVDVDGYTLAAGASYKVNPDWIIGGFIEAGWADSDSHVDGTKGEGEHDYYGVGLAMRYMINNSWYMDSSFRLGQASTEFTGVYSGDSAKYDSDAFYVTAHAGTGYIVSLTDSINLDVYGRYLITYLDGDNVSLHNKYDDKLEMDSTVTHAVRAGARLSGSFCPYAGWKVGLAYEHVFDGDAESAVNSLNLEVPSLEGDAGIMEVGVTMKPSLNSHWSMDLGAKGYVGDREGVTGSVLIRYAY